MGTWSELVKIYGGLAVVVALAVWVYIGKLVPKSVAAATQLLLEKQNEKIEKLLQERITQVTSDRNDWKAVAEKALATNDKLSDQVEGVMSIVTAIRDAGGPHHGPTN